MADATPNRGTPKRFVSLAGLTDQELAQVTERLVDDLVADAPRGPVTCPTCGSSDVRGEDGLPPTYTCVCGHRWAAPVVVLE